MNLNKLLVQLQILLTKVSYLLNKVANLLILLASFIGFAYFIYSFGFNVEARKLNTLTDNFHSLITIFFLGYLVRLITSKRSYEKKFQLEFVLFLLLFIAVVINYFSLGEFFPIFQSRVIFYILVMLISILEISRWSFAIINRTINPSLLFVLSFLLIIIIGALLLMLPKATTSPISFIDSLFTATSAVCVTGLIVVDTATQFTYLGKLIIITLIQIGGIGVMTFTTFFAFLFMKSGFHHRVVLKELLSENTLSGIFKILGSIIIVTFTIEALGAIYIYKAIKNIIEISANEQIFFAIFHSISAFCNAGFSTLSGNMADPLVKNNYSLHTGIAFLIIFGGIGFPILLNLLKLFYLKFKKVIYRAIFQKRIIEPTHIVHINTRMVIRCTITLIVVGMLSFLLLEYNNTLKGLSFSDKIAVAFFNSVTPRTAGFNNIDFTACLTPTTLIIIFLMWIGAAPMSTGGGIKVTTFSIMLLSLHNVIRGKDRMEFINRTIPQNTINRAYAVISLSILWLSFAVLLISIFDPKAEVLAIIYECVSALSTVGLTLNLTPNLSDPSKIVLILTMFFGRVGLLSLLISFFPKPKQQRYTFPEDTIMI